MTDQKAFSGWVYISKAEDVPGCWVAHCLDFGIVSIGDTPQHAFDMVREALALALVDDLNHGRDPHARRSADDEDWQALFKLFEKHTKVPVGKMDAAASSFQEFAAPITLVLVNRRLQPELGPQLHAEALHAAA